MTLADDGDRPMSDADLIARASAGEGGAWTWDALVDELSARLAAALQERDEREHYAATRDERITELLRERDELVTAHDMWKASCERNAALFDDTGYGEGFQDGADAASRGR